MNIFHQFTSDQDVESINIDSRWSPRTFGWAYTVSMWVFIHEDSCWSQRP